MKKAAAFLLLVCVVWCTAGAKIYKDVNADNGAVSFSDVPTRTSSEVKLAVPQTFSSASSGIQAEGVSTEAAAPEDEKAVSSVRIISPTPGQFFVNNADGVMPVALDIEPKNTRPKVQLLLDGTPAGSGGTGREFTLNNIDRGEHKLVAKLLDANDKVIAESEAVSFFMQRIWIRRPAS